jgi:lipid II:glycine glycyltransferase (peptidoglycan interpeptide bridge formation enzyme)
MPLPVQIYTDPQDQMAWDERVAAAPGGHLLQSWAWGELKARFGWRVQRIAVGQACAQILYRSLPGGLGTLAYIPKGPVARDESEFRLLLDEIGPLARRERAICLKIEPNLEDDPRHVHTLQQWGFRFSPQQVQPQRTLVVDLDGEPEAILQRMKQKTRYNIGLAERKGVTVRAGDESDLPAFYALMEETAQRDGFAIHSREYYDTAHRLLASTGKGRLLLAEYEGQLLGTLSVLAFGDTACYMYGATSNEHRNRMPAYALQWAAMLWAREQGCRFYDLWGVPDEDEDTLEAHFTERSDGLWGVYRFKRGYGGRLVRTIGAWDRIYAPLRYQLYRLAVRWLQRGHAD